MNNDYCLTPGTMLGENYQIIKLIGQGGMGAVYMAYDMRLELQVAIKVISPELSGQGASSASDCPLKRFESEARIAAKIDHPNVVRIYGFQRDHILLDGESREIDYLVMELLAGRTLRNTMDISGFEHEEEIASWISKYLLPILDGLKKVHECGIIHRDIKPENFLMKDETPKLADFGLSLGFNFPAVTGSIADIYGTVPYMAPEQFYNFSMARETADVYSIGKILYEVAEGKITDKVKPFKQASLSHPDTLFLQRLDAIIRDATVENVNDRIASVDELKKRLTDLVYCREKNQLERRRHPRPHLPSRKSLVLSVFLLSITVGAWGMHFAHNIAPFQEPGEVQATKEQVISQDQVQVANFRTADSQPTRRTADDSELHLITPTQPEKNSPAGRDVATEPFYLSESPVTNQQFVAFLNEIAERVSVKEGEVFLDGKLAMTIEEKIRGYIPIVYADGKFRMKDPMHSACAVLLVTGHGARAYARHYGMRLPSAREWIYIASTEEDQAGEPRPLPTPVINYTPNGYGLRGINRVAEWVKNEKGDLVILGPSPSSMIGEGYLQEEPPENYFTDTSFRVAKDA